jgi:hypothetical protein
VKHYHSANPSLSYHGVAGAAPTAFFQGVSPALPYHGVTLFQPRSINHIIIIIIIIINMLMPAYQ